MSEHVLAAARRSDTSPAMVGPGCRGAVVAARIQIDPPKAATERRRMSAGVHHSPWPPEMRTPARPPFVTMWSATARRMTSAAYVDPLRAGAKGTASVITPWAGQRNRQRHAQEAAPAREVEVSPPPAWPTVVQRARPEGAPRAAQLPAAETDVDDEALFPELGTDHADGRDREQAAEYGGASHPDLLDRFVRFRDVTNLSSGGGARLSQKIRAAWPIQGVSSSTKGAGARYL